MNTLYITPNKPTVHTQQKHDVATANQSNHPVIKIQLYSTLNTLPHIFGRHQVLCITGSATNIFFIIDKNSILPTNATEH